ncbi:MAG: rRNA maturation RNase YbeY [Planctomycetota bacterium]
MGPVGTPPHTTEPSQGLSIDLIGESSRVHPEDRARIAAALHRALGELGARGELRVRLVNDAEMVRQHGERLGEFSTTDALTFDLSDGSAGDRVLDADVLVCVDEAIRRSGERGIEVWRELTLYALHGALHCLDHDDKTEDAAARMHAEEDRLLELAGVGAVYAVGERGGAAR